MTYRKLYLTLFFLAPFLTLTGQDKDYMIVFLNKKSDLPKLSPEESKRLSDGHFANINRLASEKKLLAAGPFDGGGGIFVLNTTRTEDVLEWIGPDPGIKAERWDVEILNYRPRVGGICQQGDDAQMVEYTFVRYDVLISKYSASDYPRILKEHNDYLATVAQGSEVVTEVSFGEREGGILVLRVEPAAGLLTNDPGIQKGLVEANVKKLYIAKGSFCEK